MSTFRTIQCQCGQSIRFLQRQSGESHPCPNCGRAVAYQESSGDAPAPKGPASQSSGPQTRRVGGGAAAHGSSGKASWAGNVQRMASELGEPLSADQSTMRADHTPPTEGGQWGDAGSPQIGSGAPVRAAGVSRWALGSAIAVMLVAAITIGLLTLPTAPPRSVSPASVAIELPNGTNMFAIEKWITKGVGGDEEDNLSKLFSLHKADLRIVPTGMREGATYDWSVKCMEGGFLDGGDTIQGVAKASFMPGGKLIPHPVVLPVTGDVLKRRADRRPISFKIKVTYENSVLLERTETFVYIGRQRVPQTQVGCPKCVGAGGQPGGGCEVCEGKGAMLLPWQFAALVNPDANAIKVARKGYAESERGLPDTLEGQLAGRWPAEFPEPADKERVDFAMKVLKVFLMFREIDRHQLKYQNLTGGSDPGRASQECRTVSEVFESKSGNCIELTVTLLSLVESVGNDGAGRGFEPYILCPRGHAIAGISGSGGDIIIESTGMGLTDEESIERYAAISDKHKRMARVIEGALEAVGQGDLVRDRSWPRFWVCFDKGMEFAAVDIKHAVPVDLLRTRFGVISIDSDK